MSSLHGFEICEFPPDESVCERCNQSNKQLYFRSTDYFSQDGEYFCFDCICEHCKTGEASELEDK